MQSYTIKSGDNNLTKISQMFGMNYNDIWQANPAIKDPNKIFVGQTITIPDKPGITPPASSLEKTLPPAGNTPAGTPPIKELPTGNLDQMTLLKMMLGEASNLAKKQGTKTGLNETFGALAGQGITPENTSGSMTDKIINFVEGQVGKPIENEFDKMNLIIDSMTKSQKDLTDQQNKLKDDARQQISQAVSGNMWNDMTDDQRQKLWDSAGYVGKPVASKDTNSAAYHVTDDNGDIWNVIYDKSTGAITSKTNLGPIGKGGGGIGNTPEEKEVAAFQKDAADMIQKLDSDDISWGAAWDSLHVKYPKATNDAIDKTLGLSRRPTQ